MAVVKTSSSSEAGKNREKEEEEQEADESQPLIPGLPDEIAELCLLHLPYPYQALVRSVSSSWNSVISNPSFLLSKKSLSLSLPYLFVFGFNKRTARIQWQALDPRSDRWFVLPPMPCPKSTCPQSLAFASIPRQGMLFVLGGMSTETEMSSRATIVYRASTNRWSSASPMRTARSFFAAGNVNDKILAVGGSGGGISDSIRGVERYDPESDAWTSAAELRAGLARYDSAVLGGKMYVTEGWTWPFLFSPRGEIYDPERDTWRGMREGMREGWTGLAVVVHDRLFVLSEHGDCPMKVYDGESDTWRYVSGGRFPREAMRRPYAVTAEGDLIFVASSGLHVAVGRVGEGQNGDFNVEWNVVAAVKAFQDFSPASCQVLYA